MSRFLLAAAIPLVAAGCIELPPSARTRFHAAVGGGQTGGEGGAGGDEVMGGGGAGGEAGQGGTGGGELPPEPLPICAPGQSVDDGCATIEQIAPGDTHTCVLASDGHVWCWGSNLHGEMGDPKLGATTHNPPRVVTNLREVTQLTAGYWHTCAIAGGELYCWGGNDLGQLGDGTFDDQSESGRRIEGWRYLNRLGAGWAFLHLRSRWIEGGSRFLARLGRIWSEAGRMLRLRRKVACRLIGM